MAVKLRLARGGSKKRPHYSIVVADSRAPRDGRFIEKIGRYNPLLPKDNDQRVVIDLEAAKKWLGQGAQPTDRVARFLGEAGVVEWTHGNNPKKAVPGEKAKERLEEKAAKETEAKAVAEAPAEPEAVAEESPAEPEASSDDAAKDGA